MCLAPLGGFVGIYGLLPGSLRDARGRPTLRRSAPYRRFTARRPRRRGTCGTGRGAWIYGGM